MRHLLVFTVFLPSLFCLHVLSKECTDHKAASHTSRSEISLSNNETWREDVFSHYHLTPSDDSAWANLLPRKVVGDEDEEFAWMVIYKKMKYPEKAGISGEFLNEIPLTDVRLDINSQHGQAQQTNLEYLLSLDVDRLVWSFRKTAGLPTPGEAYGGWEILELRGHFVGHYLSATARMWASTSNTTLKDKINAVVSALYECQNKMGTGYLSAFPTEYFERLENLQTIWAPYYTIHKIIAGLVDQYLFVGNNQSLGMATRMANYFYKRVQNVVLNYGIERHWNTLNEESGGMNDVLYKLYTITGDSKHFLLAHLFDKPCFLGILAMQADNIAGFHANTHIPVVIGGQMRYELTGDPLYKEISTFFMDIVNSSHSYATGGTSAGEFWSDPKRLASSLGTGTEESCTTYNMLKVSRNIFRWTKEVAYADYYERALTNGVLSIQRGRDPGIMLYFLPLNRGASKAISSHGWGTKFDSFWCCYGTGIESFSKLGDSIFFEEGSQRPAGLYIIQYISSSLKWKSGKAFVNQTVIPVASYDPRLKVTVTISPMKEGEDPAFTLNFRIPIWADTNGTNVVLNGQPLPLPTPGNFLTITRKWSAGDKVDLELHLTVRSEAIADDRASLHAILYGPYLLAALTIDDWDVTGEPTYLSNLISPVPPEYNSHLISLTQESKNSTLSLQHLNNTIIMDTFPEPGTNTSVYATFRLLLPNATYTNFSISSKKYVIGKSYLLEPFNLPGMLLVQQGRNESLKIREASSNGTDDFAFRFVDGLNGKNGTVSLESVSEKGCYVSSSEGKVKLSCSSGQLDTSYKEAASFVMKDGVSRYHPISFVMKGERRDFLMVPLFSIMDEHYTVYFKFISS